MYATTSALAAKPGRAERETSPLALEPEAGYLRVELGQTLGERRSRVGARVVGDHHLEAERELVSQVSSRAPTFPLERPLLVVHGNDDLDQLPVGVHVVSKHDPPKRRLRAACESVETCNNSKAPEAAHGGLARRDGEGRQARGGGLEWSTDLRAGVGFMVLLSRAMRSVDGTRSSNQPDLSRP